MLSVEHARDVALFFLLLIVMGFLTASLSWFLHLCMQKDMILHRWYCFLERLSKKSKLFEKVLSKPLGLCVYCFGTWVNTCFYLIALHLKCIEYLPLAWGVNYFFLNVLSRLEPD